MRQGQERRRPVGESAKDAEQGGAQDSEEDGAIHAADHQHEDQYDADASRLYLAVAEIAQADKRGRVGDDQLCAAQSNKGDEHSDAAGGGVLQAFRDAVNDLFADAGDGEQHKQNAGKKDRAESHGPGHMHSEAH